MHGTLPALARTVADMCDEFDEKNAAIPAEIAALEEAVQRLKNVSSVQGTFGGNAFSAEPRVYERDVRAALLKSGWKAIYNRLNIDSIASASDRRLFEQAMTSPPPLTFENAKATFGKYFENPRFHILRGLAEAFCELDQSYKSHSKVKIGVKGLPKRIILRSWGEYGTGWGVDRARDVFNSLAVYRGEPVVQPGMMHRIHDDTKRGKEITFHDITVRRFGNGNAHLIFEKQALLDINRALAEFYGDVLPDVEPEEAERQPGTEVARDLQYYPTPAAVVDEALHAADIYSHERYPRRTEDAAYRVLEPSCGDGRFMDEIRKRGHDVIGIEVHAGRAMEARAKGHKVLVANFLETAPDPIFDRVVMNPPFYGRHYLKHLRHAVKFLKPGGKLVAVLPATAHYDHGELVGDIKGKWSDLPVASFAESGTNIPTGILSIYKPREAT